MESMNKNIATGILTIDLGAIALNYQNIQTYVCAFDEMAEVSAVVKANGYGLGMVEVSQALYDAGCRLFYVATLDEAMTLRAQLAEIDICVLDGLFSGAEPIYSQHNLLPCLASEKQIRAWVEFGDLPCVVHFNTGINRLGLGLDEFKNIPVEMTDKLDIHHFMSHFASADWPDDTQNAAQMAEFKLICQHLPNCNRSFGNSAGIALGELQDIEAKNLNI
ncbi:MAG: alanine racemase, partial [Rhodobacteraceae bacterium]|nr:alanine racemase [Paracoccaceae bacterium]